MTCEPATGKRLHHEESQASWTESSSLPPSGRALRAETAARPVHGAKYARFRFWFSSSGDHGFQYRTRTWRQYHHLQYPAGRCHIHHQLADPVACNYRSRPAQRRVSDRIHQYTNSSDQWRCSVARTRVTLAPGSDGSTIQGLDITDFQDPNYVTGAGIEIQSNDNLVQGNYLGPDLTGKSAGPGNAQGNLYGIVISGGSSNTIGGTTQGTGNVLSANLQAGLLIVNGTQTAEKNLVIGNDIGTDFTGNFPLGNGADGIELFASNNTIGGTLSGELNVISGNSEWGINIGANEYTTSSASAYDNLVEGNYIGTSSTGEAAIGNGLDGVTDNNDSGNTIGGTATGAGNVISGNAGEGISLYSVSKDLIAGNNIGTSPGLITEASSAFIPLGNSGDGIGLFTDSTTGSTNNTIGMPAPATSSCRTRMTVSTSSRSPMTMSYRETPWARRSAPAHPLGSARLSVWAMHLTEFNWINPPATPSAGSIQSPKVYSRSSLATSRQGTRAAAESRSRATTRRINSETS